MKESKFGTIRRWKKGRGKGIIRKKGIKNSKEESSSSSMGRIY